MSHSTKTFDRWKHILPHSWPYKVYKQYNEEVSDYLWTADSSYKFVNSQLTKNHVLDTDGVKTHFRLPSTVWNFVTEKDWKTSYDEMQNWVRLNCIMSISANLETYLASVFSLAIESDPGLLLGATKTIDGAKLLKHNQLQSDVYKLHLKKCVEGKWSERISAIKKLFGTYPTIFDTNKAELEAMRVMRNKVGHAFGRDIEAARDFTKITKQVSERVSVDRLKKWMKCAFDVAGAVDTFLLDNHIGEYQSLLAYHKNKASWDAKTSTEKVGAFKQMYGATDHQIGKRFCAELIDYYNSL